MEQSRRPGRGYHTQIRLGRWSFRENTTPAHSQQLLSEDETGITVKLRLRITNDFVMELLSRSRSVEVIAPHTLRTRLYDTLRQAAERNKPIETECN